MSKIRNLLRLYRIQKKNKA